MKGVDAPLDHWLVGCLQALINVVVGVFGYILDPEFESNANVFKENFVEAM